MKRRVCDICGRVIFNDGSFFNVKYSWFSLFRGEIIDKRKYDVCNYCDVDMRYYIKERQKEG